ncbi:MAG: hypothetical protein E7441_07455 [Ruminococcaceae bacterium]|nr:hypothetical protein [Oscillospiraceae bacterium]
MKKRFLSLAIILSMATSLFLAMTLSVGAEDTAETEYTYNFGIVDGVTASNNKYYVSNVEYVNGNYENNWRYKSVSTETIETTSELKTGRMMINTSAAEQWLALEMIIPQTGWYEIQFSSYRIANSGGVGDVYILPADADLTDIDAAVYDPKAIAVAKNVKYYDTTNGKGATSEVSVVEELGAQKYFVVFKATGGNTAEGAKSTYQMYPASLKLTKATAENAAYSPYSFEYRFANEINNGTDIKAVTYSGTRGTWAYDSSSGVDSAKKNGEYATSYGIEISAKEANSWIAFRINIPVAGKYKALYLYNKRYVYGGYGDIYLLPGNTENIGSAIDNAAKLNKEVISYYDDTTHRRGLITDLNDVTVNEAGEYLLVFYGVQKGSGYPAGVERTVNGEKVVTAGGENAACRQYPQGFLLDGSSAYQASYSGVVTVPSEIEKGTIITDSVKVWNTATGGEITDGITLSSSNELVATASGTTLTAVSAGDTTITATCSSPAVGNIIGADVTVVPDAQEKVEAAFITDGNKEENISYTASDLKGLTVDGNVINGVPNGDGSYNLTAPEKNNAGYEFVYWAKGNVAKKRILLYQTNELENYVPDESGVTYLIPVYEDMLPKTPEYYNANGQLIPDAKDSDRPYMAGYGTASGWKQYGKTNIWVAEYNNKTQPDDVTVTVENGTGTATLPYGEKVTCIANEAEEGTYFRWWQKDVNGKQEIVSVDKEYSFLAYENCTVTAVYGDSEITVTDPAKIIIDTFGENSIMAEFIGFENKTVLEKGIMFGENRIAMTAPGNQFTVTADKNGTFKGYAIVEDGNEYTLITDGEVTISDAE